MSLMQPASLSDEYSMLVEAVRGFARDVVEPEAAALDERPDDCLAAVLERAGSMGLTAALLPEDAGGQGFGVAGFVLALEELAVASAGVAAALLSHNAALLALHSSGGGDLSRFAGGTDLLSLLLPGNVVEKDGRLRGRSPFAVNGPGAAVLVGLCGGSVYSVSGGGAEGITVKPMEEQMGLRPAGIGTVELEDFACDGTRGTEEVVRGTLSIVRLGSAAISLGLMRCAFFSASEYARGRYQGGDMIINHQKIRLMLAGMLSRYYAASAAMLQASGISAGWPDTAPCLGAKIEATGKASLATEDAVQVFGGYGYMKEQGMERLMRDAAYCAVYPESNRESALLLLDTVLNS